MSEQPVSVWHPIDDQMLSAILDEDERAIRVLSLAARYHQARMAHPAGKAQATTEPLIPEDMWQPAPPLPNWAGLGRFISLYAALVLIVAGLLIGITVHRWAVLLVIGGVLLAGRIAIVHYRKEGH